MRLKVSLVNLQRITPIVGRWEVAPIAVLTSELRDERKILPSLCILQLSMGQGKLRPSQKAGLISELTPNPSLPSALSTILHSVQRHSAAWNRVRFVIPSVEERDLNGCNIFPVL